MSDTDSDSESGEDNAVHRYRTAVPIAFLWSLVQTLFGALLVYAALVKIFEQGIVDYVRHYTNFSWTLQAIFYLVTAVDPIALAVVQRKVVRFETVFIGIVLMPLFGVVVAVAILVIILLATKAQGFIDIFTMYPPGIVIIGNDVFHFFPVVALLFYIMFNRRHIFYALNAALQTSDPHRHHHTGHHHRHRRRRFSVALYLYQSYAGTAITLLIYATFFDPREVYGTDISTPLGVLLIFVSLTLSNAIPLAIAAIGWDLGSLALDERYLFGPDT